MRVDDIDSLLSLLYLYFDALEYRIQVEVDNISNRLIYNPKKLTYDEAVKLLQLKDKLEIIRVISMELHELLDSQRFK